MSQTPLGSASGYNIDLILCIDGTFSMDHIIKQVKSNAQKMPGMVDKSMNQEGKPLNAFRVKVIVFRDLAVDGNRAMEDSKFFDLNNPVEEKQFRSFVDNIKAEGGGDDPESALEAISIAMANTEWVKEGGRYRRHVIMVFTDADAHPLGHPQSMMNPLYPKGEIMPATLDELRERLMGQYPNPAFAQRNGRLIIFGPSSNDADNPNTWDKISNWGTMRRNVFHVPTKPNGGMEEFDLEDALSVLVGSI